MFIFYYITTYKCCNKNKIVPGRNRTFDDRLTADNFTIKLQGQKMREAGFEPAHPEIVGLKSTALDHSAIHANITITNIFVFLQFRFLCIFF